MAVSAGYRDFVLEQLGRVRPVTARAMFGGYGVYADGLCFALLAGDATWLKVDDSNRARFEQAGSEPFRPFGPAGEVMQYYQLPGELLDDAEALRPWLDASLAVARAARSRRSRREPPRTL
jgi:DNA transformation protein